ncbi:helix-turn-helix domain-containing protein [Streptomyces sp. SLBN-134]|uniref:helix-turn-helix domain-containing protein n=1 Tax=Streptomyces sp. SLBN-134 TaxID=2768456 RepID=UPI0037DA7363
MPTTGSVRLLPRLLESPGVHLTDLAHDLFAARQHGVQLRYDHRAYPNASQRRALAQAFGCARVVWNDCLRDRKQAHAAGRPYVTAVAAGW